jgi:hypothetical protein
MLTLALFWKGKGREVSSMECSLAFLSRTHRFLVGLRGTCVAEDGPRPDSAAGNLRNELKACDRREYCAERDQRKDEGVDCCTGDVCAISARQNGIAPRSVEHGRARNGRGAKRDERR